MHYTGATHLLDVQDFTTATEDYMMLYKVVSGQPDISVELQKRIDQLIQTASPYTSPYASEARSTGSPADSSSTDINLGSNAQYVLRAYSTTVLDM
jgi:hypothetical protein